MKLTTKSEYSLLALVHIARQQGDGFVTGDAICATYNIPKIYLGQLGVLKKNGIIRAKRGEGGGYRLAQDPQRTSIAQVIRLMDGALAPTESVSRHFFAHTPLEGEPRLVGVMQEIRDYIANRLEQLTLADLV